MAQMPMQLKSNISRILNIDSIYAIILSQEYMCTKSSFTEIQTVNRNYWLFLKTYVFVLTQVKMHGYLCSASSVQEENTENATKRDNKSHCRAKRLDCQMGVIMNNNLNSSVKTWDDYKQYLRDTDPDVSQDINEIEAQARIISTMIDQRHNLNITQRDLAEMCGIPQSSVARIESGKVSPTLNTLLKIFHHLNLSMDIHQNRTDHKAVSG